MPLTPQCIEERVESDRSSYTLCVIVALFIPSVLLRCYCCCFCAFVFEMTYEFSGKKGLCNNLLCICPASSACYALVRLKGLLVLCFGRWFRFWLHNMYLKVNFFSNSLKASYYLKWPGCFNGCRWGMNVRSKSIHFSI